MKDSIKKDADDFFATYELCLRENKSIPANINLALSGELYLKTLIYTHTGAIHKSHKLKDLLYALPLEVVEDIKTKMNYPNFDYELSKTTRIFEWLKYFYEQNDFRVNTDFVLKFVNTLQEMID